MHGGNRALLLLGEHLSGGSIDQAIIDEITRDRINSRVFANADGGRGAGRGAGSGQRRGQWQRERRRA